MTALGSRRYIGILHEIDSETSTVALEQVISYGTEGRRGVPDEEIAATEKVYDYIVFKGSDVKDLTILEPPQAKRQLPQVPDDPAIIEVSGRPYAHPAASVVSRCIVYDEDIGCNYTIPKAHTFLWRVPLPSF